MILFLLKLFICLLQVWNVFIFCSIEQNSGFYNPFFNSKTHQAFAVTRFSRQAALGAWKCCMFIHQLNNRTILSVDLITGAIVFFTRMHKVYHIKYFLIVFVSANLIWLQPEGIRKCVCLWKCVKWPTSSMLFNI